MPATKENALKFVNLHCSASKLAKYRNYAVTDFLQYYNVSFIADHISHADMQKSWALYLKWYTRQDSGGGAAYPSPINFYYLEGVDSGPTIDVEKSAEGAKEATLFGYGQCNYFADIAFDLLKKPAVGQMEGMGPLVEKISTPGHNWVIVNRDAATKEDWVVVDVWLYALGIPLNECVCPAEDAAVAFYKNKIELVETWNPNA